MINGIETYDPNFRPLLKRYAFGDFARYCTAHRMKDISEPAPTTIGHKAAYWLGEAANNDLHVGLPILAVTLPSDKFLVDMTADWYVGVASMREIDQVTHELELAGSVHPIGAAVLHFASSGPYVTNDALLLLDRMCPRPFVVSH